MTNEEHVEEILIEAYKLGLTSQVFEIVKSLSKEYAEHVMKNSHHLIVQ